MLCGWARQPVDVLTVEPAGVGCLQVQPIETIRVGSNVQSEVGGEQVSMLCDTAPTAVDPLRERLFLAVPAQAGLGQGRGHGVVLVETFPAGAFSLATDHLHDHPRCPDPNTSPEGLLPPEVIELLACAIGAVGDQRVGRPT